jgi:hypothetical protein
VYDRGIYVYAHSKIEEGPFKGSNKISWLNNYDYTLLDKEERSDGKPKPEVWTIKLLKTLAIVKGLIHG